MSIDPGLRINIAGRVLAVVIIWNTAFGVSVLAAAPSTNQLQPETVNAWEDYIRSVDSRMQARFGGETPFLWIHESAERSRRIARGEIVVEPALAQGTQSVPNGLMHHWIGGVFIPGARIGSVSAVVHDYRKYKDFYKPVVADSKVLDCTETNQRFSMLWRHKVLFITAAIQSEYLGHHVKVDRLREYNVADTVRVQEIEHYGRPEERLLPPGTGSGFIWRMHSIARYEERDGGVYLELEAIALTRDIPASVRWFVNPVVNHLSVNSLTTTLQQTRDAVNSIAQNAEARSLCQNR
jgi:hypothetical protein